MGGSGSGNWSRLNSKSLVESCLTLDARYLARKRYLEPWKSYPLAWQNCSSILVRTEPDAIELSYTITNDKLHEKVSYKIPLSWTSCNYGGKRPWFICPGKNCWKRVAKLYLMHGYFLCRHCHELAYSSQGESKPFRLLHKSQKICRQLGASNSDGLFTAPKPKGMHQSTYDRLRLRAEELETESLFAMAERLKIKV